jgi:hypothetical protein
VPAPKSLISDRSAAEVATVNTGTAGAKNAVLTSLPKAAETSLNAKGTARVAHISFLSSDEILKVGEKRRLAVQFNSDVPLSLVLFALRFNPKVVKVTGVSAASLLFSSPNAAPVIGQSIDANGVCLVSISALSGRTAIKGSGQLIFVDVEAVGTGDAAFVFDKDTLHLVAIDALDVVPEVSQGRAAVKQ